MPKKHSPQFGCIYTNTYDEECRKPGLGTPPLCHRHEKYRDAIEDALAVEQDEIIDQAVGALFERPEVQKLANKVSSIFDRAAEFLDKATSGKIPMADFQGFRPNQRHAASSQPPNAPSPQKEDPKIVLGFKPEQKLTKEMVRKRKKQLAKMFHPDLGFDPHFMVKFNAAADELLKALPA